MQPSDSTGEPAEPSFPVALQRADPVPTGAAAREQLEQRRSAGQNVPPPRIPPPAAQGPPRRGREHGSRCNAAWQRANEQPSPALEPTTWDAAKRHAMLLLPSAAASRDTGTVNEPPTPVLEPTSRDAPAASSASSAAASRDAPMRDHIFCVNCQQRRGDERCIRCNLHPLCTRCMPMHGCIP